MHDNDGKAVDIVAPEGGLTAGQFYYDPVTGWAGSVLDTVDEGEGVSLEIVRGHRYNLLSSLNIAVGDVLHVQDDGSLGVGADSAARPYMKVTEVVEGVTDTEDQVIGVLLPQTWAKFALGES
jgi:hypothetical protein